jgi:type II secretory pathway component PulC
MRIKLVIAIICALDVAAAAEPDPPTPTETHDARLIPTYDADAQVFVGFKVYAIRARGRFDAMKFANGDLLERVNGFALTTVEGAKALDDDVIAGHADATVVVERKGALVTLATTAIP